MRADLTGVLDRDIIEQGLQVLLAEDARLSGVRRAVGLVEEALRGRRFSPRL